MKSEISYQRCHASLLSGAVYCDGSIRSSGFNGENVRSSSVLVVKEHLRLPRWTAVRNIPQLNEEVCLFA